MSEISGKVTIGNGCYINPGSSIIAEGGEIVIGEYNIIEV